MLIGVSKSKKKGYVDVTIGNDIKFTLSASNAGALGTKLINCSSSIFIDNKKTHAITGTPEELNGRFKTILKGDALSVTKLEQHLENEKNGSVLDIKNKRIGNRKFDTYTGD